MAHFSSLICVSISAQVRICCLSTSKRQMSRFSVPPKSRRHVVLSNKKSVFGQSETHTCGVRQPTNGTDASTHLARSKKNRYGLSMTTLSMPHFRPSVSVGTRTRSKSPFFSAGNRFAVKRGGFIVGIQNTKSNMVKKRSKNCYIYRNGRQSPIHKEMRQRSIDKTHQYTIASSTAHWNSYHASIVHLQKIQNSLLILVCTFQKWISIDK